MAQHMCLYKLVCEIAETEYHMNIALVKWSDRTLLSGWIILGLGWLNIAFIEWNLIKFNFQNPSGLEKYLYSTLMAFNIYCAKTSVMPL